ncbi:MAG: FHA domain-containing protein [Planctomycetes bacterium]|nr:FHA domain-containing protein [Planctomycetota bacterium]
MAEARTAVVFRALAMPGRKPRGEWSSESIEVGARSSCALVLNDPVVAERHCALHRENGRFWVEDLGSVTGTWVNGAELSGRRELASGDGIVLGVSRLSVQIEAGADGPLLELRVEEASFHYRRAGPDNYKGPRESWVVSDADRWVQSEVRFGRIPAVRRAAWAGALLGLIGAVALFATDAGQRWLQPAPLAGNHGRVIQDCAQCHEHGRPGAVATCVMCHANLFPRSHPFMDGERELALAERGIAAPDNACLMCHPTHHQTQPLELAANADEAALRAAFGAPARELARARMAELSADANDALCATCHTQPPSSQSDATLARVLELAADPRLATVGEAFTSHAYGFERFSHAKHLGAKPSMDCAVCHQPLEQDGGDGAEFASVSFEHCASCHVESPELARNVPERAEMVRASRSALAARGGGIVALSWHGSDSGKCTQCHAKTNEKPLARVERESVAHSFELRSRSHSDQARALAGHPRQDCAKCHADAQTLAGGETLARPFLHGAHVATLFPKNAAETAESASHCVECHAGQWDSTSTAQSTSVALESACQQCHGAGNAPTARESARTKRETTLFSHQAHARVDGSCFACHEFGFDGANADPEDPRATPRLRQGVEDCTACHSSHAAIQGGSCSYCHAASPVPGESADAEQFRGERYLREDWPAGLNFSHFSGDPTGRTGGHRALMADSNGASQCFTCHDETNLRGAQTVSEVKIPDGRMLRCVECHALQGGWFHWQLPRPK